MLISVSRVLCLMCVVIIAASCANTAPRQTFPEITFHHLSPIEMAISTITIDDQYVPPLTVPNAEHRMPIAPQMVLNRWPGDRIAATNGDATATFTIVRAEVLEQALDIDGNITAIFTNEQALRYDASVEAVFEVQSNDGLSQGQATARASRSITVPENATLNEREQAQFTLVENTMREFDTQMELNIRKHLGHWLP